MSKPIPITPGLFERIKQTNPIIVTSFFNGIEIHKIIYPEIAEYDVYIDPEFADMRFTEIIKSEFVPDLPEKPLKN